LDLNITPGIALGPFRLGLPINTLIAFLESDAAHFPQVEFIYDEKAPLAKDMILKCPPTGLLLRFDPSSQRLRVAEAFDFTLQRLMYHDAEFSTNGEKKIVPTFVLIYKLFG